jgi:hypothetical protein
MSDKEDTLAALGWSEKLKVKHPPGAQIPALLQRPEHGSHVPAGVRRQKSGDVFEDNPARAWAQAGSEVHEAKEKAAPRPGQPGALPGDGKVLAGESSNENVNWSEAFCISPDPFRVVVDGHARKVPPVHSAGLGLDLAGPGGGHPGVVQAKVQAAAAGEEGARLHAASSSNSLPCSARIIRSTLRERHSARRSAVSARSSA